jgi:exonuclease VII large subunit
MSIDLQDPIAAGRSATQTVSRRAADAVDLARSVDLPAPAAVVEQARKRANRAAKHLEHQVDHVSKRAGKRANRAAQQLERKVDHVSKRAARRAHAESQRVAKATGNQRGGRKVLVTLLVLVGGAAVVAVLARRMRHVSAEQPAPDPFGTAVRATDPTREFDGTSVTTG